MRAGDIVAQVEGITTRGRGGKWKENQTNTIQGMKTCMRRKLKGEGAIVCTDEGRVA